MHKKALEYLRQNCASDEIVKCMAYRLLNKSIIIPKVSGDDSFIARTYLKNGEVIVEYNQNLFNESGKDFNMMGIPQLAWVLVHEACHVLFGDFDNIEPEKNHMLLNIAADSRINSCIITDNTLVKVSNNLVPCTKIFKSKPNNEKKRMFYAGVYDIYDRSYTRDEIYNILEDLMKQQNRQNSMQQDTDNSESGEKGDESSSGNSGGDSSEVRQDVTVGDLVKIIIDNEDELSSQDKSIAEEYEKQAISEEIEKIAQEVSEQSVYVVEDVLKFIGRAKPKSTNKKLWTKIVSKYIDGLGSRTTSKIRTWRRPNRRYDCFPGHKVSRYRAVSVFVDVSSSMSASMIKAAENVAVLSQFNNGLEHLILWNTDLVNDIRNANKKKVLDALQYSGGGTSLYEGIKYLVSVSKHDELLIIISDLQDDSNIGGLINKIAKTRTVIVGYPKDDNETKYLIKGITAVTIGI